MKKDMQYLQVIFNDMDSDKDGKLSPQELQQNRVVLSMGQQISIEEAEAAMMSVDSDGDGYLCLEEFVRLVEGGGDEERNNDLKEAFKMYEVQEGEGGYIDAMSLKRMLSRLGESKTVEECRKMIAHFDLNGDGILSFHEFKTMMSC